MNEEYKVHDDLIYYKNRIFLVLGSTLKRKILGTAHDAPVVGHPGFVKTDHNSLRHFLTQKELNDRQQKWVIKVQSFDFDIEYKKGKMNVVADALSRWATFSLLQICKDWKIQLATEYSKDRFACDVLDGLNQNEEYKVHEDLIY